MTPAPLPVVRAWYRVERVAPGLRWITEPHVAPLLSANLWWVCGADRDLVVDTGLGVGSLRTCMPDMFARAPLAVLTHAHLDHGGGAYEFPDVAAHPAERSSIENPPPRVTLRGADVYQLLGLDPRGERVPDVLLRARPSPSFDPERYAIRAATVTRTLVDGDRLDLGDRALTVVHLPGHSPGSVALLDERAGWLFSGDVVYDDELLDDLVGSDVGRYVGSMRRLSTLDVRTVYPGHGAPFGGDVLHRIIREYVRSRT